MVDENEDPEAAANRLETALERIARSAARPRDTAADDSALSAEEIAARLDRLIDRLRTVLGNRPD